MKDETANMIINGSVKSFYVRTLIAYDSESDQTLPKKGLSFEIGEIFYVKNASDINWWRALKLNPIKTVIDVCDEGLIPSAGRLLRKYTSKEVSVNFSERTTVIEANGNQTLDKINLNDKRGFGSIDLKRKRQQAFMKCAIIKADVKNKLSDFYEIVETLKFPSHRPVVVLGPGRSNLYEKLIEYYQDEFASPVNHTTRRKRETEVDGIDYHFIENKDDFVKDKEAGIFVETVEYSGNFYGTSLLAVQTVMASKKHCIIDATVAVINNLENNGIPPISILICPDSYLVAKDLMTGSNDEKLIKTTMQYSSLLNSKSPQIFAAKLRCENMTELIKETYTTIMNCQKWGVWKRSENHDKLDYGIS